MFVLTFNLLCDLNVCSMLSACHIKKDCILQMVSRFSNLYMLPVGKKQEL